MCPTSTTSRCESSPTAQEFRQAFNVLDKDRDGKISAHDLQTFYTGFSAAASEEDISSMISVADLNNNGVVDLEEFEQVVCPKRSSLTKKKVMWDMFKVMDRDGDGKVGFDDLRGYMSWAGFVASDEDIIAMIELGGGNQKDGVGFDGFIQILQIDSL